MKNQAKFALCMLTIAAAFAVPARADVLLTITADKVHGGTDWSFSKGSGTIQANMSDVLPAAPIGTATPFMQLHTLVSDSSLTVLSGTNVLNINTLFAFDYGSVIGGLPGVNGQLGQGLDMQGSGSWNGMAVSALNGLTFNADEIGYSLFNPGTYDLSDYYSGYGTSFGKFTLQVGPAGNSVPEPGSLALLGLGLAGVGAMRRKSRKA